MDDVRFLGIGGLLARYSAGTLSPVDVVEAHLEAIERLNPRLNAYVRVTTDLARSQALAASRALRSGHAAGPLVGIPVGLKDLYDVAGVPTTAGSRIPRAESATSDCLVAERLRFDGAVFLGKHHLHEWALGVTSINPHFGPCRNPWDPERVPGGSSGGSGAALAAGLCAGAFGSDTGGSVRIPSSLCGVTGLKPTLGRISLRGVVPLSWHLDHAGPMARSAIDVALLLRAVDVYDPLDPTSVDGPRADPTAGLDSDVRGLRVLAPEGFFFDTADGEVAEAVVGALKVLERAGARIERAALPGIEELSALNGTLVVADAAASHREPLRDHLDEFGADVLARMRRGEAATAIEYSLARYAGVRWRRQLELLLEGSAVLVVPATPIVAPRIDTTDSAAIAPTLTAFTGAFNLTGLPALSVPCGFSRGGLPIGLQIVSRGWADGLVLAVGAAYQRLTDWHLRRPPLA